VRLDVQDRQLLNLKQGVWGEEAGHTAAAGKQWGGAGGCLFSTGGIWTVAASVAGVVQGREAGCTAATAPVEKLGVAGSFGVAVPGHLAVLYLAAAA
jgi:hypothetical protein